MSGSCFGSDSASEVVEPAESSLEVEQTTMCCPSENPGVIHNFIFYIPPTTPETVTRITTPPRLSVIDLGAIDISEITQNPQKYGIRPIAEILNLPTSETITRPALHALGETRSIFTSASELPQGAGGISGSSRFYIDIAVLERHGAKIITTSELIADLRALKTQQPTMGNRIDKLINAIQTVEREVLIQGRAPASAVMTEGQHNALRNWDKLGKGLFIVGIVLTVYDLGDATYQSVQQSSIRPISAEVIRQAGGWGAAWAGAKIGALGGAAIGIETGPGALLTGAAGALIFGIAGYFGADWVADHIYEN